VRAIRTPAKERIESSHYRVIAVTSSRA